MLYYAAGGMVLLRGLIHLSGLAIYAHFYKCDPMAKPGAEEPAYVVILYVLTVLTRVPGLAGIFVAAIYAAVLRYLEMLFSSVPRIGLVCFMILLVRIIYIKLFPLIYIKHRNNNMVLL